MPALANGGRRRNYRSNSHTSQRDGDSTSNTEGPTTHRAGTRAVQIEDEDEPHMSRVTVCHNDHAEVIKNWREPTTHRDVRLFLGFSDFYRLFIKDYSSPATSLTSLTKGGDSDDFHWTIEAQAAFYRLKVAFSCVDLPYA